MYKKYKKDQEIMNITMTTSSDSSFTTTSNLDADSQHAMTTSTMSRWTTPSNLQPNLDLASKTKLGRPSRTFIE